MALSSLQLRAHLAQTLASHHACESFDLVPVLTGITCLHSTLRKRLEWHTPTYQLGLLCLRQAKRCNAGAIMLAHSSHTALMIHLHALAVKARHSRLPPYVIGLSLCQANADSIP